MSGGRVVICDDREDRREDWKRDLGALDALAGWDIELLAEDGGERDIDTELNLLHGRQLAARDGAKGQRPTEESWFDGADIVIVDYDLALFENVPGLTGENVAYLARCYSSCKVIVGVNLTGHTNPFDLTLIDHLDSFADVNIGSDQLIAPALWGEEPRGLSAWAWPRLPALLQNHDQIVEAVGEGSSQLVETLGLGGIALPRQVRQLIESDGEEDPSFERFVRQSDLGLRGEDGPEEGAIARVGAARARKWLHTSVLPAQDLLIDAPHLAQRNPLLLGPEARGGSIAAEAWDRTVDRDDPRGGMIAELDAHRVTPSPWSDGPLWRWAELNSDDALPGVESPWERPEPDHVFCEDVSRFLPPRLARSFVFDDIPTSLATRYVSRANGEVEELVCGPLGDVQYMPRLRLTL